MNKNQLYRVYWNRVIYNTNRTKKTSKMRILPTPIFIFEENIIRKLNWNYTFGSNLG